jgi:hypothetical protein
MLGFCGAIWTGAVRTVQCPHRHRQQAITRRPLPFEVARRDCRRPFRVTEARGLLGLMNNQERFRWERMT